MYWKSSYPIGLSRVSTFLFHWQIKNIKSKPYQVVTLLLTLFSQRRLHIVITTAMAPRKRISRIASRSVATVEQFTKRINCRSVGTQTDILAKGPAKRKKVENKVKLLDSQPLSSQYLAIHLMPAINPLATETINRRPDTFSYFLPGPNEKSCQAVADRIADASDRVITASSGERQINHLKSVVSNRREEANQWDRNRLEILLAQINGDPPPRWNSATQLWLEVDMLEKRIEAYDQEELQNAKNRNLDRKLDGGQDKGPSDEKDQQTLKTLKAT